jgi:hypothetical protein
MFCNSFYKVIFSNFEITKGEKSMFKPGAKLIWVLAVIFILSTSCSLYNKMKEKLSSEKKEDSKEKTTGGETKELTAGDDVTFYNKYIDVLNKIQEAGDKVNKDYISEIPEPKSITKNSLIIAVSLSLSVNNLERVIKEINRSYYDGGELSKLSAGSEMKEEIEGELKKVLRAADAYYNTASKVSDYYSKGEYKKNLDKAVPYNDEMRTAYEKYAKALDGFTIAVKKHKPKREKRDLNSISDPGEFSVTVLTIAYENTADKAEEFYDSFIMVEYKGDLSEPKKILAEFEEVLKSEKSTVMNTEFTDKTKHLKYSYEDYFLKMSNMFLESAKKFFEGAPNAKNQNEFNRLYDDVVTNYNYMISAYNTNINVIYTYQIW